MNHAPDQVRQSIVHVLDEWAKPERTTVLSALSRLARQAVGYPLSVSESASTELWRVPAIDPVARFVFGRSALALSTYAEVEWLRHRKLAESRVADFCGFPRRSRRMGFLHGVDFGR